MNVPDTVETEFAKVVVQAAASGMIALAKKLPALFRRQGFRREEFVAAELERTRASLLAAGEDDGRQLVRQEAAWEVLVRGLLTEHPDAAAEVSALSAEIRAALSAAPRTVYQQYVSGGSAGAQGPGATAVVYHRPEA
ncbi:hypothetical protein [Rugosimonospora africana]|uniref:Uncharacterized protein n=1 Tax=Rugosimonospora africana TaxID=556532 RepID=A0A8J3VUX4_9ACTN|nr:hypothetical protein [Rugosimonospora africana]GIH20052.1 hypothetical protein Raf01_82240 [Rugosimonospora africana]